VISTASIVVRVQEAWDKFRQVTRLGRIRWMMKQVLYIIAIWLLWIVNWPHLFSVLPDAINPFETAFVTHPILLPSNTHDMLRAA
jgi:hypothetical protein